MTRKRVSQRNIRLGESSPAKLEKGPTSIVVMSAGETEIVAASMAVLKMHSTATEQGVRELTQDANAATCESSEDRDFKI